jgi:hypothetical protein
MRSRPPTVTVAAILLVSRVSENLPVTRRERGCPQSGLAGLLAPSLRKKSRYPRKCTKT